MTVKRFAIFHTNAVAKIAADGIDMVDDPPFAIRFRLIVPELALIGLDGGDLTLPLITYIHNEAGLWMQTQVCCVEVEDFFGIVRLK